MRTAAVVWLALVAATLSSWLLGAESTGSSVGVVALTLAFIKARLIGLHFMELKRAPVGLRLAFEGWCLAVSGMVLGMFLA